MNLIKAEKLTKIKTSVEKSSQLTRSSENFQKCGILGSVMLKKPQGAAEAQGSGPRGQLSPRVTYEASEAQNPLTTERQQLGPPEKEEREGTGYWIKVGLRQGTVRVC